MEHRTYRFCTVALELARMHGTYLAASFLAEQGVPIDYAMAALAGNTNRTGWPRAHTAPVSNGGAP
jgi:hypothetical protein